MKKYIFLLIVISAYNAVLCQNNYNNRLPKNRPDLKYTEIYDGVYKIENKDGQIIYKDYRNYPDKKTGSPVENFVFYVDQMDTLLYGKNYRLWKEVPVAGQIDDYLRVGDINQNKNAELYGYVKTFTSSFDTTPVKIYEYELSDSSFHYKFSYADTVKVPIGIYDVDRDGNEEFFAMQNLTNLGFYKPVWQFSLPTNFFFTYDAQFPMYHTQFGDYDRDGKTEMLYYSWSNPDKKVVIMKYNNNIKNFDSLYTYTETALVGDGFSTGDIDGDGYPLIVSANIAGQVHAQKYTLKDGTWAFRNVWNDSVATPNAYLHTSTNDIDGNGKNEFWVGGDGFHNGMPITRLTCFEPDKERGYKAVTQIDIAGIMSTYAFNMFAKDVDNCGKDELCLCLDNLFIILKFTGNSDKHSYGLYYVKKNDLPQDSLHSSNYFGAVMADVNNDGVPEILISLDQQKWIHYPDIGAKCRRFTYIYKRDDVSGVEDNKGIINTFSLSNNYPNPFNPSTTISYQLPKGCEVALKIYDILGNEVKTLVNEYKQAGSYTVSFDASKLSSGVYIYRITAGGYTAARKMMFVK